MERSRILRRALNTAPDLIDVMVRLETAGRALRAARDVAADRPAVRERITEIVDAVENLIEGVVDFHDALKD
jgi:hypothetical protein